MVRGASVKYPVERPADADVRLSKMARDVRSVLGQHGFWDVDRAELAKMLHEVLFGSRGAAGELEARINGTAAPLVSDEGKLDAYDCLAAAHELRRVKGAQGALVIAMSSDGHLSSAVAADQGSMMDIVGNEVIDKLDVVLEARGWKLPEMQDVAMDFTVDAEGKAS